MGDLSYNRTRIFRNSHPLHGSHATHPSMLTACVTSRQLKIVADTDAKFMAHVYMHFVLVKPYTSTLKLYVAVVRRPVTYQVIVGCVLSGSAWFFRPDQKLKKRLKVLLILLQSINTWWSWNSVSLIDTESLGARFLIRCSSLIPFDDSIASIYEPPTE